MSLIVEKESIDKLEDFFRKAYTFNKYSNMFEYDKMSTRENEEANELQVQVSVKVTSGEVPLATHTKPDGTTGQHYDWDNFIPKETTTHVVDYIIPISESSVVDLEESGKRKVQINSARLNNLCKFTKNAVTMHCLDENGKDNKIAILYEKEIIELRNADFESYTVNLKYFCKKLGIFEECFPMDNPDYINDSLIEDMNEYTDFMDSISRLTISDKIIAKFAIISEGDIQLTNKVDAQLIKTLFSISMLDDKDIKDKYNAKTPFDYIYMDAISSLVMDLSEQVNNFRQATAYNYKKNEQIYNRVIQYAINKFFHMQSTAINDVQTIKDSNTLSVMSQGKSIYFYGREFDPKTERWTPWDKEKIDYNTFKYFNGVLDPSRSRDSKLINTSNELTVGTEIIGDDIYVTVKVIKTNESVKLKMTDFVMNKILSEENYQYGKVIPNRNNKYTILQYQKYTTLDELTEDVIYARTYESLVSYSTGLMPFINRMVPTRVLMSSNFLDQSIPVVGAKPPIVHTDFNKKIYENNPDNIKVNYYGTVIDVKNQYIKIQDDNGVVHLEGKYEHSATSNHTTNFYHPTVKVGDRVVPNQIVSCSNSFVDGEYSTQVPLVVCFGTYLASEHEDGILLTESAAKRFGHPTVAEVSESFSKNKYLYEFIPNTDNPKLDNWSLIKKGEPVVYGDVLFRIKRMSAKNFRNALNGTIGLTDVAAFTDESMYEIFELKVPYNVREDGIIESVRISFNTDDDYVWYPRGNSAISYPPLNWEDNPVISECVTYYSNLYTEEDRELSKYIGQKVDYTYDFSEDTKSAFHIEIVIKHTNTMDTDRLSGKLSNYYGSKGVNTDIIKDDMAPVVDGLYDENGNPLKIDCFISSLSTYSRKNPGQIDEAKLGLIGLQGWVKFVKNGKKTDPKIIEFLNNLYPSGWNWNQLQSDGKRYGYIRIQVEHFDRYYTPAKISELLNQLGLGDGNFKIRLPVFNNKLTEFKNTVGVCSLMRLHFIQENKSSYTPEGSNSIIEASDNIGYSDLERIGGQKISSQEVWAASAHGILDVIEDNAVKNDNKRANFTAAALLLGLKLNTDK